MAGSVAATVCPKCLGARHLTEIAVNAPAPPLGPGGGPIAAPGSVGVAFYYRVIACPLCHDLRPTQVTFDPNARVGP